MWWQRCDHNGRWNNILHCPCFINPQDQAPNSSSVRFSTYHPCPGDRNWGTAKRNNVTSLSLWRNQGQMYLFPLDRDHLSLKVSKLGHFETKASNQGLMRIEEMKVHFKRRSVQAKKLRWPYSWKSFLICFWLWLSWARLLSRLELVYSVAEDGIHNDWCSCLCIHFQEIGLQVWSTTLSHIYFSRVNRCNEYRTEKSGRVDVLQNGARSSVETKTRLKGHSHSHFLHMALLRYFFSLYKHNEWGVYEVLSACVLLTHTQPCHRSHCGKAFFRPGSNER